MKHDKYCRDYENVVISNGFSFLHKKPTRKCITAETYLDHVVVNFDKKFSFCEVLNDVISDHLPILSKFGNRKTLKQYFTYRDYSALLQKNISSDIEENLRISEYDVIDNLNDSFNSFSEDLVNVFNVKFPIKRKILKQKKQWVDNSVKKLIAKKNEACRKWIQSAKIEHKIVFKKLRNKIKSCIRTKRTFFYNMKFQSSIGDNKKVYGIINEICSNTRTSTPIILHVDDKQIENAFQKAEHFNNFFSNIGHKLAAKIPAQDLNLSQVKNLGNSMYFYEVTEFEVFNLIANLATKKSSGFDGISNFFFHIFQIPL